MSAATRRAALAAVIWALLPAALPAQPPTPYAMPMHDDQWYGMLALEQLEYRAGDGDEVLRWEGHAWYGDGLERVWLRSEGAHAVDDAEAEVEVQLLYSRLVSPFWELQGGLRYDREVAGDAALAHLVVGLQGTAPYRFDTTAALFLGDDGALSLRLTSLRSVLLTQRWSLQLRGEIEAASSAARAFGRGSGLNALELGVRVRYQVRPELVPYLGVHWERRLGGSAELARDAGQGAGDLQLVGGISFWF